MYHNMKPEPIELRVLKQKLANFSCKCINCDKYNKFYKGNKTGENAGVQADMANCLSSQCSQDAQDSVITDTNKIDKANGTSFINTLCKDYICPSCRYIVDFLRGSLNKVLKDEESLTKAIECCDKSTDKPIDSLDRTTSMTKKCNSACEMKTQFSAEFIPSNNYRKPEKVTFVDSKNITVVDSERDKFETPEKYTIVNADKATLVDLIGYENKTGHSKLLKCKTCVCMEKFIDSIRPPLMD